MSTTKISDLPVLSSADAADEFVVVDDSAGVTKKITQGDLNVLVENADDYEEGTWSPDLVNANTYTADFTEYVRVGNTVFVTARFTSFGNSESGDFRIENPPFVVTSRGAGSVYVVNTSSNVNSISADVNAGANGFLVRGDAITSLDTSILSKVDSGTIVQFSATYITS